MTRIASSSQKTAALCCLLTLNAAAGQPRFSALDALRAEWQRRPPTLSAEALAPADAARLDLSLKRIAAPGAPALLPPELEKPTVEAWQARAGAARTPQERFTALYFLNRLKAPGALAALDGLGAEDAAAWPRALHLEGPVATARLNGAIPTPALMAFLTALGLAGKGDPVRAEAARIRLVLAGKENGEAHLDLTHLASLDAWNRGPWEPRAGEHLAALAPALAPGADPGAAQRLLEGLPAQALAGAVAAAVAVLARPGPVLVRAAALDYLARVPALEPAVLARLEPLAQANQAAPLWGNWLAVLRKHAPASARSLGLKLLAKSEPLTLAAAIENLREAPADLDGLAQRLWSAEQYDGVQTLLGSLERWKLPEAARKLLLLRFQEHPCWTVRLDAYRQLVKLNPEIPWPEMPEPAPAEAAILKSAQRLRAAGRPLRLRISFSGNRQVTLRLDPVNAPINVANLAQLAGKGYFDGRLVPRVVPDFVVQMGSPCDTMDGGPGYTVRCEDSLDWYGPGSVGMALSGKDTGGSQFFITTNATPHLTGRYTRVGVLEDPEHALPLLDGLELGAKIVRVRVVGK